MPHTSTSDTILPVDREVQAAVEGQRALAACLATRTEIQRIQIFDDENCAHQVELPTSALRLLVDSSLNSPMATPSRSCLFMLG